jgi:D-serine deaminase-like pyridoxal phosphate-dependent protein
MQISDLITPAVLVDQKRLTNNIRRMAEKAKQNGVALRPHIKTHKCINIAKLQLEQGAHGVTVSTLGEAFAFSEVIDDMTLAFPITPDKVNGVTALSEKVSLNVLVDHIDAAKALEDGGRNQGVEIQTLVKVDMGYHRCGVNPEDKTAIDLVRFIHDSPHLSFEGILTHAGNSYHGKTREEVEVAAEQEQSVMVRFAGKLEDEDRDLKPKTVSIGSTPSLMVSDHIQDGVTEIRPGSYVFYDYMQVRLGACQLTDCALSVLGSVVGVYPNRLVTDTGDTALSLDPGPVHIEPDCGYGVVLEEYESGKNALDTTISGLSQEHGKVSLGPGSPLHNARIGDRIRITPNHSCLVSNLTPRFYVVDDAQVIEIWDVCRQRYGVETIS